MTPIEAHRRALLAAAHLAMVAPLLSCESPRSAVHALPPGGLTPTAAAEPVQVSPSPARHVGAESCEIVLDEAFPGEDNFTGKDREVSPRVRDCCVQHLGAAPGAPTGRSHHWACCEGVSRVEGIDPAILHGCSPWGPPPPPAMAPRRLA
ncbi:MAG: hypothetical protein IPH07_37625 [Deltaproteobacteria bacterium]|nr:hypothetical protein [Deltaproteobacteria bacterium]MBP7289680.1 hypothetical protein [Nannocystaceae bacterium]